MAVSAQSLAAMSDDDLQYWITFHEQWADRDHTAAGSEGLGMRPATDGVDLMAALRESLTAARYASTRAHVEALEACRVELARRNTETPKENQ